MGQDRGCNVGACRKKERKKERNPCGIKAGWKTMIMSSLLVSLQEKAKLMSSGNKLSTLVLILHWEQNSGFPNIMTGAGWSEHIYKMGQECALMFSPKMQIDFTGSQRWTVDTQLKLMTALLGIWKEWWTLHFHVMGMRWEPFLPLPSGFSHSDLEDTGSND